MEGKEAVRSKVGRRMAYILRYGALEEGLKVSNNGFTKVDDLLQLESMQRYTKEDLLAEVEKLTVSGKKRFEVALDKDNMFIRATHNRKFAPAGKHKDSEVNRLLEICTAFICNNIKIYDLEHFPDEFLLRQIFYRLKFKKKLTNAVLPNVIGRVMEEIDFNDVYVTEKTIKLVCKRCPELKSLSLKNCGYIITDNVLKWLLKELPNLVSLNLCGCDSIRDKGLQEISKWCRQLKKLSISYLPLVTKDGLTSLVENCPSLEQLFVQGIPVVNQNFVEELLQVREVNNLSKIELKIFASCNTS
eukprot:gene12097-2697_t